MRPIELTFTGLRSYRSTTTIDFTNLDLFAVIGDTGAGKSTIIEALSLALYGTYTWSGGKLEELIADGMNTMSIQLRFAADGDEWVVTRTRHRNASAPVNKLECAAREEKVDGNRAVNERIERLLGLTHDQFIRAVVMPQGRFDELLRAKKTERNRILRSIFGLDDLKLTREAAEALRAQWTPTKDRAIAKREELPVDPAAEKAGAEERLATADKAATRLREAAEAGDAHDRAITALGGSIGRLTTALGAVPDDIGDPAGGLAALADRAAGIDERRRRADDDRQAAVAAGQRLERQRTETLAGFARRDDAAQAKVTVTSAAGELDRAAAELASASAELARLAGAPPPDTVDAALTQRAAATRATADAAEQAAREARRRADEGRALWRGLAGARAAAVAAADRVADAQAAVRDQQAAVEAANTAVWAASRALTEAKVAHSDALLADAAAAAGAGCRPGDPCPVCARDLPAGFTPPPSGDLDAAVAAVERAEAELERLRDAATRAGGLHTRAAAELEQLTATAAEAAAAAEGLRDEAARAGVDVDAGEDTAAVAALEAAASAAAAEARTAADAAATARDAVTEAETALRLAVERHRELVSAAQVAVEGATRRIDAQRRRVAGLPDAWRPAPDAGADALRRLAARIEGCLGALDTLEARQATVDAARTDAEQRLAALRVERAESVAGPAARTLDTVRAYLGRVSDVAAAVAAAVDAFDLEPVELAAAGAVPDPDGDLRAASAAVARLAAGAAGVCATARRLAGELTDRHRSASEALAGLLADAGCENLSALHRASGQASTELVDARAAVVAAGKAMARAAELDEVIAVVRPFVANLDVLAATLRDQYFVGHLVSLREAELLAEATRRLKKITGGRYGFVPNFGVVDIASGEIRTPDNLSGGERFQAALALALALVEIASRGAGRLDAVFVDEGFGTLDSAALDAALDTLGTVAGGGKMVALVSHLRPVADYVDTVLHVTKDDLFGSTITVLVGEDREQFLADDIRSGLTS
jgi:exonuclease SbcC